MTSPRGIHVACNSACCLLTFVCRRWYGYRCIEEKGEPGNVAEMAARVDAFPLASFESYATTPCCQVWGSIK